MNRLWLILVIVVVVALFDIGFLSLYEFNFLYDGHISEALREEWIHATITRLKTVQPGQTIPVSDFVINKSGSHYSFGAEAVIWLNGEEWIYIISHSSHQDKGIGDQTLAVDSAGNMYINTGHVCGGSTYTSSSNERPRTSLDFFTKFLGFAGEKWQSIPNYEANNPSQCMHSIAGPE